MVFDFVELALPDLKTVAEVKLLTRLVEGLIYSHAEAEQHLVYLALDHALEHEGQLKRLHQHHREIDNRLERVHSADTLADARRLLMAALGASREHFNSEERLIFPLVEEKLQEETLTALAQALRQRRMALAS